MLIYQVRKMPSDRRRFFIVQNVQKFEKKVEEFLKKNGIPTGKYKGK